MENQAFEQIILDQATLTALWEADSRKKARDKESWMLYMEDIKKIMPMSNSTFSLVGFQKVDPVEEEEKL